MRRETVVTTVLCLTQLASAILTVDRRSPVQRQTQAAGYVYDGPTPPSYNISIPIDHFDSSNNQTYSNRYWVNDTFYQPGGPIFLMDFGEGGITNQAAAEYLAEVNQSSAVMRLAERYHGLAILWEHRYFGLSLPVPMNQTTHEPEGGVDGYKYLTIDQALEDAAYFAQRFCPADHKDDCDTFSPSKTPWIWLGSSYPGLRAALSRIRSPDVWYATWSSSAPVQARYDGSLYFDPIQASLPSNCSNDVLAAIKYADEVMSGVHGTQTYQEFQRLMFVASVTQGDLTGAGGYNASSGYIYGQYELASMLASAITSNFQSYGPSATILSFCNYFETFNPNGTATNTTDPYITILTNSGDGQITDDGIAATYNASTALNAYVYASRQFQHDFYSRPRNNGSLVESPPNAAADFSSWQYIIYTALGWFQGSDPDNVTVISRFDNVSIIHERQTRFFYNITAEDLPDMPNVTDINKYGGWNAHPSNTMFTAGEYDPWRGGTVMSEETWLGAPLREVTQDVPQCGRSPDGTDVFGLVLPGTVHAQDLRSQDGKSQDGTEAMTLALSLFQKALDVWLPCFNSSRVASR